VSDRIRGETPSSSSLAHSQRGPWRHDLAWWIFSTDQISQWSVVVTAELVDPSVTGTLWATPPASFREVTD